MPRYVAPAVLYGENISAEAETIVREAEAPLRQWINDSVENLQKDFVAKIQLAGQELEKEANSLSQEHEKLSQDLESLAKNLNELKLNLGAGNDPELLQ